VARRKERARTQMSDVVRARWQAHDALFGVFVAHPPDSMTVADVPWLDIKLLQMAHAHSPETVDIKALQSRWHPDKFTQKFGGRFGPGEREAILARVTDVSAAINELGRQ
jgi:hypothetical protein